MASGGFPPVPVGTAVAETRVLPIEVTAVGNAEASSSVEIKSQVAGPLLGVRFTEGAYVQKDDLLFQIDTRPYDEALRQAEATHARTLAQLRLAEANLSKSQAQLRNADAERKRFEELARAGISTRMQEDQIRTTAEVAEQSVRAEEATIETIRATLQSDRAAIDRAKLELSYCEIRSPLSGRTGNLLVHPGNLVKANGDSPLVVINQVSPIFVSFGVPERYFREIQTKSVAQRLLVEAVNEQNPSDVIRGTLAVVDNTVDRNTGTIRLKATFANPDGRLWPGQFVNVRLRLGTLTATTIPSESVQEGQQGSFVYVVKADQTVEARLLKVGQTVESKVVVEEGIQPGETVVSDGQSRLFPGARIQAVQAGAEVKQSSGTP